MPDVQDSVFAILRKYLNEHPGGDIPMDEELTNLGLDSMKSISLLLDLENSLGFVFPDELLNAETFRTARHLISAVERLSASHD